MLFDELNYNCFGEIITCILSLILIFNVLMTFSIDSKRHRFFVWGSISSFVAAFCDIISVSSVTAIMGAALILKTEKDELKIEEKNVKIASDIAKEIKKLMCRE